MLSADENGVSAQDLCAVILAGGRSRRMGRNKALLELGGEPLILRLTRLVSRFADEVLLSADDAAAFRFLGLPLVPDVHPGTGPMAGLHAAMTYSGRPLFLVLACDLPHVTGGLLRLILSHSPGRDIVVPRTSDGRLHPLCACYRRTVLPEIEVRLRAGLCRMADLASVPTLGVAELTTGFDDGALVNWNSPNDLLP